MSVTLVRQKVKDGSLEEALANPYVWMGLAPGASLGDVKRADRRLAMHVHPDHVRL
jgi:curved DNA-binding protein CbpA